MNLYKDKTKVLIITHYAFAKRTQNGPGGPALLDYFLPKVKQITYIEHPYPTIKNQKSYLIIYIDGKIKSRLIISVISGHQIIKYLHHIIITIYFIITSKSIYHLCIGIGNFASLPVLPFRLVGIIKYFVYYVFDYNSFRFSSNILNKLYISLDQFSYITADSNWILNNKANINRRINGLELSKYKRSAIVPIGYNNAQIPHYKINQIKYFNIVFAGAMLENSGPQLPILSLPKLIQQFPKIKLIMIGDGPYLNTLKKLARNLKVEKYIKFHGFIEDFSEMTEIVARSSIGLATYFPNPKSPSAVSDPSKVKLYLACGIPVIITSINPIISLIHRKNAGIVIEYNENEFIAAIKELLSNKEVLQGYKDASYNLSNQFDIHHIMDKAIKSL